MNLETKLITEIKGEFFVPAYQRGYRWDREALQLLDDIMDIDEKKDDKYCLQPIVVKKIGEDKYELIDGQQRLTTLYLIFKAVKTYVPFVNTEFSLTYETRQKSEEFLMNISVDSEETNIDFYFMKKAFVGITNWLESQAKKHVARPFNFFKLLSEKVVIIWYEAEQEEDSNQLFQRLNIGKIPLTSAELVKAIFLCESSKNSVTESKQEEIAYQWDSIEKELHDDSFWFFLTNNNAVNYQTRIDLVLNLMSNTDPYDGDQYATFFYFDNLRKQENLSEIWEKIQHTYLILKDWYGNHEFYHLIGYLISTDTKLIDIYNLSLDKTKTAFIDSLKAMIKKTVALKDKNYGDLSYDNQTDYKSITNLLLLFNVISTKNNGEQSEWFAFDKYKKNKWSLEHIHAQQSEGMKTQAQWKEWLRLHVNSIKTVGGEDQTQELVSKMEKCISEEYTLQLTEFETIRLEVESILSEDMNVGYLHSISNLALLRKEDNSALNNSTFDVKRNEIIAMDKKGLFIPFCTKMVFLKYYTKSEENQLHFWGYVDRKSYIDAINFTLKDYIEPVTMYMEEEENG